MKEFDKNAIDFDLAKLGASSEHVIANCYRFTYSITKYLENIK